MSELPQGWAEVEFADVTEARSGNSKLIKGKLLTSPVEGAHPAFSASGQDVWHTAYEHEGDAVVVSAVGARCGKAFFASGRWSAIANTHIVKPTGAVEPRFLYLYLNDEDFWEKGGSAQPFVKVPATLARPLHLPPLTEQRRIVARIDSLTGKSRRARDHLDHIPRLVEKYKQAVLATAFRGDLTREWREANGLPELRSVRLDDVAESFNYGSSAKSAKEGAVPVLRMGNIQDGKLDWTDLVFTNDAAEIVKYRLVSGDVLFNRTNSPALVGKTALYDGKREAIYAGYLIRVRCKPELLPAFLTYCLNSPLGRAYSWAVKSDGVSQSNINAKKLAAFRFDLPSLEEQAEIVRGIEAAFSWIDRLASDATSARRLIDRLDQTVLAKAFRGELTPQDPADEPASVLLDRIRAERAAAPKSARGRKRKVA